MKNNLSYCHDKNLPNFLEKKIINRLMTMYNISKSEAFITIRKLYRKDNIYLARVAVDLFSNNSKSLYINKLNSFVLNELSTIQGKRPSFIKNIKNC